MVLAHKIHDCCAKPSNNGERERGRERERGGGEIERDRERKRACKGRELDPTTREQRALFGELDPVPVCFLQLVGTRYLFKAVRTLGKN